MEHRAANPESRPVVMNVFKITTIDQQTLNLHGCSMLFTYSAGDIIVRFLQGSERCQK